MMKIFLALLLAMGVVGGTAGQGFSDDELLIFAVVSEVPKNKARVAVKASVNDAVSDSKLLASEAILNNLIWKNLEICHAMRAEGTNTAEGYQVVTVRVIDAAMLPLNVAAIVCG